MAKRRRVAYAEEDGKCGGQRSPIDRISKLPDELLVHILSFLTLKEATTTSILSCRWRYLWARAPKLHFDGNELFLDVMFGNGEEEVRLNKARQKYVKWVNQAIALHNDSTVEEFRVSFNFTKTHKICLYRWLRYALSRKVQILELDLRINDYLAERNYDEFAFPNKLLQIRKEKLSRGSESMRHVNPVDFKYLKKVSMNYVNVNGEAVEFFLRNCPLLEHLSISKSRELSCLKIIGPFPALKHLEITHCNIDSLEIRDVNLVYLKYRGLRIPFILKNVPLLVEIFVGGMLPSRMEDVLLMLSRYLPQLEILTIEALYLPSQWSWTETKIFYSAIKMSNLKQLVVRIHIYNDKTLLPLTNLLRASPCLQRFVLEVLHEGHKIVKRNIQKIARSYSHLKEVEFLGYFGMTNEVELVMHFLENAVALEKILIDPREPFKTRGYWYNLWRNKSVETKVEIKGRSRAKRDLTEIVPPRINLKIL